MSFPRPPIGPDDRGVLAAIAFLLTASVGLSACSRTEAVQQPINYNHRLHVVDQELECTDCHEHARDLARATIPSTDICAECHDPESPNSDSPEEAKLLKYIERGEDVPWKKVYRVADHVYFSHRRHTVLAQLECSACHGEMEQRENAVDRQAVPMTMKTCVNCHKESGVSTDCTRCHR